MWPSPSASPRHDGTTLQVHDLLRDKTRRFHGRRTEPIVDAQTNVAETSQGIDAGKKIKGRKRHLITDTLGLVLAVLVTAANVHDTTGGKLLLAHAAPPPGAGLRSPPTEVESDDPLGDG